MPRYRGECGHCSYVAHSLAAMEKHIISHENDNPDQPFSHPIKTKQDCEATHDDEQVEESDEDQIRGECDDGDWGSRVDEMVMVDEGVDDTMLEATEPDEGIEDNDSHLIFDDVIESEEDEDDSHLIFDEVLEPEKENNTVESSDVLERDSDKCLFSTICDKVHMPEDEEEMGNQQVTGKQGLLLDQQKGKCEAMQVSEKVEEEPEVDGRTRNKSTMGIKEDVSLKTGDTDEDNEKVLALNPKNYISQEPEVDDEHKKENILALRTKDHISQTAQDVIDGKENESFSTSSTKDNVSKKDEVTHLILEKGGKDAIEYSEGHKQIYDDNDNIEGVSKSGLNGKVFIPGTLNEYRISDTEQNSDKDNTFQKMDRQSKQMDKDMCMQYIGTEGELCSISETAHINTMAIPDQKKEDYHQLETTEKECESTSEANSGQRPLGTVKDVDKCTELNSDTNIDCGNSADNNSITSTVQEVTTHNKVDDARGDQDADLQVKDAQQYILPSDVVWMGPENVQEKVINSQNYGNSLSGVLHTEQPSCVSQDSENETAAQTKLKVPYSRPRRKIRSKRCVSDHGYSRFEKTDTFDIFDETDTKLEDTTAHHPTIRMDSKDIIKTKSGGNQMQSTETVLEKKDEIDQKQCKKTVTNCMNIKKMRSILPKEMPQKVGEEAFSSLTVTQKLNITHHSGSFHNSSDNQNLSTKSSKVAISDPSSVIIVTSQPSKTVPTKLILKFDKTITTRTATNVPKMINVGTVKKTMPTTKMLALAVSKASQSRTAINLHKTADTGLVKKTTTTTNVAVSKYAQSTSKLVSLAGIHNQKREPILLTLSNGLLSKRGAFRTSPGTSPRAKFIQSLKIKQTTRKDEGQNKKQSSESDKKPVSLLAQALTGFPPGLGPSESVVEVESALPPAKILAMGDEGGYVCTVDECFEVFWHRPQFCSHVLAFHRLNARLFYCPYCNFVSTSMNIVQAHTSQCQNKKKNNENNKKEVNVTKNKPLVTDTENDTPTLCDKKQNQTEMKTCKSEDLDNVPEKKITKLILSPEKDGTLYTPKCDGQQCRVVSSQIKYKAKQEHLNEDWKYFCAYCCNRAGSSIEKTLSHARNMHTRGAQDKTATVTVLRRKLIHVPLINESDVKRKVDNEDMDSPKRKRSRCDDDDTADSPYRKSLDESGWKNDSDTEKAVHIQLHNYTKTQEQEIYEKKVPKQYVLAVREEVIMADLEDSGEGTPFVVYEDGLDSSIATEMSPDTSLVICSPDSLQPGPQSSHKTCDTPKRPVGRPIRKTDSSSDSVVQKIRKKYKYSKQATALEVRDEKGENDDNFFWRKRRNQPGFVRVKRPKPVNEDVDGATAETDTTAEPSTYSIIKKNRHSPKTDVDKPFNIPFVKFKTPSRKMRTEGPVPIVKQRKVKLKEDGKMVWYYRRKESGCGVIEVCKKPSPTKQSLGVRVSARGRKPKVFEDCVLHEDFEEDMHDDSLPIMLMQVPIFDKLVVVRSSLRGDKKLLMIPVVELVDIMKAFANMSLSIDNSTCLSDESDSGMSTGEADFDASTDAELDTTRNQAELHTTRNQAELDTTRDQSELDTTRDR